MRSRAPRQFCSWSSENPWFRSLGNLWRISKWASQTLWRFSSARKSTSRKKIRSVHEVGELKRAQEMRIDDFSRNELRESYVTSQIQELQLRMNYTSDSRQLQEKEAICSGKWSHIPSQPAVFPSPRSLLSRDQSLRSDTWNLSVTQGNLCENPRAAIDSSHIPSQGFLHSTNQKATGGNTVQKSTGRRVANSEARIGSEFCKNSSTMNSFSPAGITKEFYGWLAKTAITELHFDKFATPPTFSHWKIRFKTRRHVYIVEAQLSLCADVDSQCCTSLNLDLSFLVVTALFESKQQTRVHTPIALHQLAPSAHVKTQVSSCSDFPSEAMLWIMWEVSCAGFRHSAGLHARVILDAATCQPRKPGDVRDILSVLVVW